MRKLFVVCCLFIVYCLVVWLFGCLAVWLFGCLVQNTQNTCKHRHKQEKNTQEPKDELIKMKKEITKMKKEHKEEMKNTRDEMKNTERTSGPRDFGAGLTSSNQVSCLCHIVHST